MHEISDKEVLCFEIDMHDLWRVSAVSLSLSDFNFILFFFVDTSDDSGPEEGQSSSGDEELEPEADQLTSRGKIVM